MNLRLNQTNFNYHLQNKAKLLQRSSKMKRCTVRHHLFNVDKACLYKFLLLHSNLAWNSKNEEALEYAKAVSDKGFRKYNDAFEFANLLAQYKAYDLSFQILEIHIPDFLLEMQYRFGANYKNILETGELHPSIIPAMFQYVCLGKYFSDKDLELHQDILRDMLRESSQKELYFVLYREKFNKEIFRNTKELNENKKTLKELNLYDFYIF